MKRPPFFVQQLLSAAAFGGCMAAGLAATAYLFKLLLPYIRP
jgi:hypothetical protein